MSLAIRWVECFLDTNWIKISEQMSYFRWIIENEILPEIYIYEMKYVK